MLRLINFAHSEIFMLGTFAALFAHRRGMGIDRRRPVQTGSRSSRVMLVLPGRRMVVSGGAAVVLERVAYRPLRKRGAPRLAALITAIGISLVLQEFLALRDAAATIEPFPRRRSSKSTLFTFFGADIRTDKVLVFVAALVMMVALDQFVSRTRLGRGIRAVAQDPETAQLMGVNIDRVVMLTFLLGGILAGAAGLLFVIFFEVDRGTTSASSSASRRSPPRCSAASATSAARCSAACSSA